MSDGAERKRKENAVESVKNSQPAERGPGKRREAAEAVDALKQHVDNKGCL